MLFALAQTSQISSSASANLRGLRVWPKARGPQSPSVQALSSYGLGTTELYGVRIWMDLHPQPDL